ncbi:MAG: peptidoglycan -binding protein [Kiloniellales bacterium]
MQSAGRRASRRTFNVWPGFVDALSSLLLVIIFVLLVFIISHFFLSIALTGRDEALQRLETQVNELANLLSLERSASAELRLNVAQLSAELQSSLAAREELSSQIAAFGSERERLQSALAEAEAKEAQARAALEQLEETTAADREKVELQLAEIAALQQAREELARRLTEADAENAKVAKELEDAYKAIDADKEKIERLLSEIAILQSLRDELTNRLASAEEATSEQQRLTEDAERQVLILNRQIQALRQQLARIAAALEASEAEAKQQDVQIADLGRRLNVALASKVQELARYRSEFFGRLREVLGDNPNIRIVGDRFVFQSEVLFATGSAELGEPGKVQLSRFAATLKEIAAKIPPGIDWILRVDGHTDRRPINTFAFPSNWELSTARAVSVVKYLITEGIPPERLVAAGFGEFYPLEEGNGEADWERNRLIELNIDQL